MSKGNPKPTRFNDTEQRAIDAIKNRSGLPAAEIIRRSLRLLYRACKEQGTSVLLDIPELTEKEVEALASVVPKSQAPAGAASTRSLYTPSTAEVRAQRQNEGKSEGPRTRSARPGIRRTVAGK